MKNAWQLLITTVVSQLKVVIDFFFCAFSGKIHQLQEIISRFADFFPRQNTYNIFSRIADERPTKQSIGQAHDMSRVRRVSPAYRHSRLYGIDEGHPQRHSQATVAESAMHHESSLHPVDRADSPT